MSEQSTEHEHEASIDLRDPLVAAVLAWLIPGLGHLYQRRFAKAALYFLCIMTLFGYGLAMGSLPEEGWYGRVVYYSWRPGDKRLFYICQVGAGLAGFQAPPRHPNDPVRPDDPNRDQPTPHELYSRLPRYFELGTVYTAIAGLLNILAIYDAWGGPVPPARKKKDEEDKDEDQDAEEEN
ncbi:MAG: DUF6677 family protein [Thermoguttaceae bacterium]